MTEKDFRIYWGEFGFVTVKVVVKGRMKPEVFVLPKVPGVKVVDVATGKITLWDDLKKYAMHGVLE